jgi:Patatin-like phospholipase
MNEGDSVSFGAVLQAEMQIILPSCLAPTLKNRDQSERDLPNPGTRVTAAENAIENQMLKAIDASDTDLAALCLSGGGIRSATFALGIMQGLARYSLLGQFHYLSTVSGGGYIGSWLSAWRARASDAEVFKTLNISQTTGKEAPQVLGLRADSNYLTPSLGLLSADTWTLIALYIRNLVLNWLLFVPFFMGCFMIPRLCVAVLRWANDGPLVESLFGTAMVLGFACISAGLIFSVYGRFRRQGKWLSKGRFLAVVLVPMVIAGASFTVAAVSKSDLTRDRLANAFAHGGLAYGALAGAAVYFGAWVIGRVAARKYANYIKVWNLVSWTLAGAVVGIIIAAGMRFIAAQLADSYSTVDLNSVTVFGLSGCVLSYLLGELVYVGASSFSRDGDMDREWLARSSGWLAAIAIAWAAVSLVSLYAPDWLLWGQSELIALGAGSISGIVTLVLGWSGKTAATKAGEALKSLSLIRIASIAAVVFAVSLAVLLSLLDQQLQMALTTRFAIPELPLTAALCVALVSTAFFISYFVNVNRFSMHALYRNRLVRAFLGSARGESRTPDPFTGFDPNDNLKMAQAAPRSAPDRLFHVINTALNVVSSKNLAWQERKAESFAITRLFAGNPIVRFQPTSGYGDRHGGISLGTAMAISGAAVSPNQGYNSSPLIAFLLMLFNVRLGWWLGNPRKKTYSQEGPVWGIIPALKELAGNTTDDGKWIYLSDGGHFENLGLYEMIRRRCRIVVLSDAGCDPQFNFEDLGNAVRKIFIDFGVSVDFQKLEIRARQNPPVPGLRFAIGTITYPGSTKPGWLLYLKPTYQGTDERADVRSYAASHPSFPHESTTDQWFSESQLESYRALGASIAEYVCSGGAPARPGASPDPMTLQSLRHVTEAYLAALSESEQASQAPLTKSEPR